MIHYQVEVDSGTVLGNEISGYVVLNLGRGMHIAYIVATDCCGNITRKKLILNVAVITPPTANCAQSREYNIRNVATTEYLAKISADYFNEGNTYCDSIFTKVIRFEQLKGTHNGSQENQIDTSSKCIEKNGDDNLSLDGNQIYFDDDIIVCCSDLDKPISVLLRVFDRNPGNGPVEPSRMDKGSILFNHFSDCLVELTIKDQIAPILVAPPNIVVSCSFLIDIKNLANPNDPTFGRVVTDLSNRQPVYTNDKVCYHYCVKNDITGYPGYDSGAPPSNTPAWNKACDYYKTLFDSSNTDQKYKLAWGFDGYVLSACENVPTISVTDKRKCGQGQITRSIIVIGPGIKVTANQMIWVVECDPFYINRNDDCDPNDDMIWPGNCTGQATTINDCGASLSPENPLLGKPIINKNANDQCASLSIEYSDEMLSNEPDACFKILRTWLVIDKCHYDHSKDTVTGRWKYLQLIKIHDVEKPDLKIKIGNQSAPDSNGLALINITVEVSDNCLPANDIKLTYQIDEFNDGIGPYSGYDFKVGPLSLNEFNKGGIPLFNFNPRAFNQRNTSDASGKYPIGIHKIRWVAKDACGNVNLGSELFEITKVVSTVTAEKNQQLIIMPNPSKGNTLIKSESKIDRIRLISATSQEIQSFSIQNKQSFEINNLASGVYFVQAFYKGNHLASGKLVIMD